MCYILPDIYNNPHRRYIYMFHCLSQQCFFRFNFSDNYCDCVYIGGRMFVFNVKLNNLEKLSQLCN